MKCISLEKNPTSPQKTFERLEWYNKGRHESNKPLRGDSVVVSSLQSTLENMQVNLIPKDFESAKVPSQKQLRKISVHRSFKLIKKDFGVFQEEL